MKNLLFLLISIFTFNITYSQNDLCDEFLSNEVFPKEQSVSYTEEVWGLLSCGLDSTEVHMLSNKAYMGVLMIQWSTSEKGLSTYRDLLTHFNDFKKTDDYTPIYKSAEALEKLKTTTVSLANWEKDKEELLKLVVSEEYIELMHENAAGNENITYTKLLVLVIEKKVEVERELEKSFSSTAAFCGEINSASKAVPQGIVGYMNDLESAVECSKNLNKPLLIYFAGHACVNCRKIEMNVWDDAGVRKSLNEDYVIVYLYLDDKTELPESERKEVLIKSTGRTIVVNTIGQKNSLLQMMKYEVNTKPYFIVEDVKGNKLRTTGYTKDAKEFLHFLKQK